MVVWRHKTGLSSHAAPTCILIFGLQVTAALPCSCHLPLEIGHHAHQEGSQGGGGQDVGREDALPGEVEARVGTRTWLHLNCVRRPLQVFQQFDVDGSGAIDFDEFTAMLVRMYGRFPPLHSSPRVADCASQQKALHINISYGCELCAVMHSPLQPL